MNDLTSIQAALNNCINQLANKQKEKQGYFNMAAEIGEVYERLVDDKKIIKVYRDSVKTFLNENYGTFNGNLHSEVYKVQLKSLINEYNVVINNIDINMDRLNTLRAQYENKAYSCDGVIGYLESSINTLTHTIQNWVN